MACNSISSFVIRWSPIILAVYKYTNKMLPSLFYNMFNPYADNHKYNTRFATNFKFPNNKMEFGNKAMSYQGAKIWNSIPSYI